MKEVLKGMIYEEKYDEELNCMVKYKVYHIYNNNGYIHINAPFPVKYLKKLRLYLEYKKIDYENIIIGRPDI